MSDELLAGSECPICLETLRPPIRMLPCGHNFCQTCLEGLSSSKSFQRCPTCRHFVQLGKNKVEILSRNFALESLIENIKKANFKSKTNPKEAPKKGITKVEIDQLGRLSIYLIDTKNYKEALEKLQTILMHGGTVDALLALLDKIQCLIEINNADDAFACAVEVKSLVETNISKTEVKNEAEKIYKSLDKLIQILINKNQINYVHLLLKCRLVIINECFSQKHRLLKLETTGNLLQTTFVNLTKQKTKKIDLKEYFLLMDDILESLQATSDVDWYLKCKTVTLFLRRCGLCCNESSNWFKSLKYNNQAIGLLETAFPKKAAKDPILGHCYYSVACAYEELNGFPEAIKSFETAITLYKSCIFATEEERKKHISKAEKKINLAFVGRRSFGSMSTLSAMRLRNRLSQRGVIAMPK